MPKVLLIGNCPLPSEKVRINPAAGLRTQQFLDVLKNLNEIELRVVKIAMPECYEKLPESKYEGDEILLNKNESGLGRKLQKIHDDFEPEIIVAVNTYPSFLAAKIESKAYFWADLNGWVLAEAQAQAYKMGGDDYLPHYLEMEKLVVERADKISTVSEAQAHAVMGEMAMLGRLGKENFGKELVVRVVNCVDVAEDEEAVESKFSAVPEEAFVALWLGGYNTWVDENMLFDGIEAAMKQCEKLYFVSTGGDLKGLDNKTFANFKGKIENSDLKDRFIFLGWVDKEQIPGLHHRADIGLNVDRLCAETLMGARNRINEMMKYGLPVVSTLGSEISYEMEKAGAGLGVESGNAGQLKELIVKLYKGWEGGSGELKEMGKKGQQYIKECCDSEKELKVLTEWIKNPVKAAKAKQVGRIKMALSYLKNNGLKKALKKFSTRLNW